MPVQYELHTTFLGGKGEDMLTVVAYTMGKLSERLVSVHPCISEEAKTKLFEAAKMIREELRAAGVWEDPGAPKLVQSKPI